MSKLQNIYDKSPIWIQEILINCYGIKTALLRYTGKYKSLKQKYLEKDYFDYSEQLADQNKQLQQFLQYCVMHSSYYNELLKGIDLESFNINRLGEIPYLEKEVLRNNVDIIATCKEIVSNTGGTTGKSLEIFYSKEDIQRRLAYLDAFKELHGVKLGMRAARFSGKNLISHDYKPTSEGKYWRTNWLINQRLYSTFHMNESTLSLYIEDLNRFKPKSLDGFITSIYELAKYIENNNIKLAFYPIAIFPTAETILPHYREVVERVFCCPIRDQYASSEGAPFITECPHGNMHYCMDTGVIEIIGKNPLKGEIAVTSFTSHGTPLIRYLIGDVIEFSEEPCSCGCAHPVVKSIIGRNTDYLYSEERGVIYSANMSNAIKYLPNAVQSIQYIQKKADYIEINVVYDRAKYTPENNESIIKEMKQRLGDRITFKINEVDEIPKSKSGKFRFIVNEIH